MIYAIKYVLNRFMYCKVIDLIGLQITIVIVFFLSCYLVLYNNKKT